MLGRFRILVSLSAALPISATDGEPVFNYRGTLDTAHFLGKLFRTLKEVLHIDGPPPDHQALDVDPPSTADSASTLNSANNASTNEGEKRKT